MKDCWSFITTVDHWYERLLIMYDKHWSLPWKPVDHVSQLLIMYRIVITSCFPNVKVEFRDSSQICTTASIFSKSYYFRQKYFEIPSCAVSLFIYIWVWVEQSQLLLWNLQKKSIASGWMWIRFWGRVEHNPKNSMPNILRQWRYSKIYL